MVFCSDPLNPRAPDSVFMREADAAEALGLRRFLIDHDALDRHHSAGAAVRRVRPEGPTEAVYRGWMLRAEDHELLHAALAAKGVHLVNSPTQYQACHWGPLAYPFIARWAAPSRFATADFARLTDGGWLLIEVGDGQASELPEAADPAALLSAVAAKGSGN